ncbi:RdgB/HAM1 family non-canonical purine NTP pyrophosphatase [Nitrospina gracilis]|uniref:RdgB/HAM1 family non-canonical purine NTP pyrophosphatase n=1 Tax=Nitrospina gracilis TaxID=35801 RepID=UPI001F01AA36|nr:RdgB/HAM1 family non-canonical purine NTP pyrophosphatase [Nitrospina gracilis]MCF8720549.1 non-canonical purine NTP pyrophosphatase (RdgB/HAM1 family) [Nitrospina gracilis Nb-211]
MKHHPLWKQLKFVTGNPNKFREAQEILGIEMERRDLAHLHEIQTTDVAELVEHKATEAWETLNAPVLVEDSGLIFEAWNGLPGALVKWFEVSVGCEGMLKMLEPFPNRRARAVCMVAVHDGREIVVGKGEVAGTIAHSLRGENGFGWDVIFIPDGHDRTFGEMSVGEKNAISHRRRAFEALRDQL